MSPVLEISFKGIPSSDAVRDRIEQRCDKLIQISDRILRIRAVVEQPHHHHRKGRLYHVGVDLTLPGTEIVVNRVHALDPSHEDVLVAVRDAFDATERQLVQHVHKRDGGQRRHEAGPGPA